MSKAEAIRDERNVLVEVCAFIGREMMKSDLRW